MTLSKDNDNHDDEDPPSRRESHFNQQRSSLRSDQSDPIHARSRPHSKHRLEDFDILGNTTHTDRADSETLPSPASPAPNVPCTRSRQGKPRSHAKSSHRRTPDDAESWRNPYKILTQPAIPLHDFQPKSRREYAHASSTPPSRGSRARPHPKDRADTPGSQLDITALPSMHEASRPDDPPTAPKSRVATELYTISYLIFFAILGTLARLGLQALTFYPGAPVIFSELWANVAGTFIIGLLAEDRRLFHAEWGRNTRERDDDEERVPEPDDRPAEYHAQQGKRHAKIKKTIPLYIGLATGLSGSLTSFSSFQRDIFLALSNDLATPSLPTLSPTPRHAGYSVMSVLAVILVTISACYAALKVGAHVALACQPITPVLPFRFTRRFLDPCIVFLGWGCWIGAILMTIFPPASHSAWRAQVLFALVFAPLGCLARYYTSLFLNPILPSFPLGTFTVNMFGTAVLGMAYGLQRVRFQGSGVVGCQVLQGIEDGFCGCMTTVSTWILELDGLRMGRAWVYGVVSVGAGMGLLVAIMGGVRWSVGWEGVVCT